MKANSLFSKVQLLIGCQSLTKATQEHYPLLTVFFYMKSTKLLSITVNCMEKSSIRQQTIHMHGHNKHSNHMSNPPFIHLFWMHCKTNFIHFKLFIFFLLNFILNKVQWWANLCFPFFLYDFLSNRQRVTFCSCIACFRMLNSFSIVYIKTRNSFKKHQYKKKSYFALQTKRHLYLIMFETKMLYCIY